MTTYAIGDIQGCLDELDALLNLVGFSSADKLWLVGDLVNRGPRSRETMDYVIGLGDQVECVLGNHEFHFLAIHSGGHSASSSDTFNDMLDQPNADQYAEWLRNRKLVHVDKDLGYVMTHAGIPHIWNVEKAEALSREVEAVLRDEADIGYEQFCRELYGNEPDIWSDDLEGMRRYRLITNYLTRMRLIDQSGRLDFSHKGALLDAPPGWQPWFSFENALTFGKRTMHLVFGHWAALDGSTGRADLIALDTGCVWGRKLTAYCLDTQETFAVSAMRTYG